MREPISLKEILAVIIGKGKVLICWALVFALLLGAYRFWNLWEASQKPENSQQQIQQRYQEALEDHAAYHASLENQLKKAQAKLERQNEYYSSSLLMDMNPYGTAKCTMLLAISDLNPQPEQGTDSTEDRLEKRTQKIQDMYMLYWASADLKSEMQKQGYPAIEEKYHRETVKIELTSGGTITITAVGKEPRDATLLAQAAYNCLQTLKPKIEDSSYSHSLSVMYSATKTVVSSEIEKRQENAKALCRSYADEVDGLQKQINSLTEPQPEPGYGSSVFVKGILKWMLLGSLAGVFLGCVWVLLMLLVRSKAESARQLEKLLAVPFLGSVAKQDSFFRRLSCKLLCERRWEDPDAAAAYIRESLRAAVEHQEALVILTSRGEKNAAAIQAAEAAAAAACAKVSTVYGANTNPQTIPALSGGKKVLLAESLGSSELPDILSLLETAKRLQATVIGFITI